jgi:hypothetical protein
MEQDEDDDLDNIDYDTLLPEEEEENPKNTVRQLVDALSIKFIIFLFVSQFMGKGMLFTGLRRVMLPYFKNMPVQVNAFNLQMYSLLVSMPWVIKPLFGLCSDFVTLLGFQKRFYLIFTSCIGIVSSASLLILSLKPDTPPIFIALCMMGVSVQISMYDLLSQGKYSEIRNETPQLGSSITNMVHGFISCGSLLAMLYVGYISDAKLFYIIFIINLILSSSLMVPTVMGFLSEHRLVNAKWIQLVSLDRIYRERHFIMVIAFTGIGGIICTLVATLASPVVGLCMSGALLFLSMMGAYKVFPTLITRVALYQVVTSLSSPNLGSVLGEEIFCILCLFTHEKKYINLLVSQKQKVYDVKKLHPQKFYITNFLSLKSQKVYNVEKHPGVVPYNKNGIVNLLVSEKQKVYNVKKCPEVTFEHFLTL